MPSRLSIIALIFIIAFVAASGRLFFLQVFRYTHYDAEAEGQQQITREVSSRRGTIYARSAPDEGEHVAVAISRRTWNIWAVPQKIDFSEREDLAKGLASVLDIDFEDTLARLSKEDDPYEPIKSNVNDETLELVNALGHDAIGVTPEQGRYYPTQSLAAHVLGFVSRDDNGGKYGVEEYFDEQLSGLGGSVKGFRNPFGKLISALSNVSRPEEGADVYLTIDHNIQRALEARLEDARERFRARNVQAVVVRPDTGEIIAMASVPSFNPNTYSETEDLSLFINPLVQGVFEPGSVFKPITMASALDIHVVSPDMTYTDRGYTKVANHTIRNSGERVEGVQTMTQVLEKSLNTGIVEVVTRMPRGVWREYIQRFGFGERTGVELSGEVRGDIDNVLNGGPVEIATSAFGQGVAVTPLELVMAIGALANDGVLMRPYIVDEIISGDGERLYEGRPQERERVVGKNTAEQITQMLVSVVENGSGWGAKMDGYWVAGKTGTAQIAAAGGYSDEVNHTFVGYAPAFNPEFVMMVKLEDPKGVEYSEVSAGPLFKGISTFILNYYGIEPDKPVE